MSGATPRVIPSPDDDNEDDGDDGDDDDDDDDGNRSDGDECSYLAKDLLLEIDNGVAQHSANLNNTKT